jgi:ADP-heptose:LPS heptosyltransferase
MRESPHITSNRIDIFAEALGVAVPRFSGARYALAPIDDSGAPRALELLARFPATHRPTVGIQLRSAESYKDAPVLLDVARLLAPHYNVVVFDSRPIAQLPDDEFLAVADEPLPVVLSLLTRLAAIITPDSFALHFAGAYGIPCIGVFGPTDGRVRVSTYPSAKFVDAGAHLACVPCWRHQYSKCRVSDSLESVCMKSISPSEVIAALQDLLDNPGR